MPQITLMAANSASPRRLTGPLLAISTSSYSGGRWVIPAAGGPILSKRNHDQPEHCLRSIWTDARRAHRAEIAVAPADGQPPGEGATTPHVQAAAADKAGEPASAAAADKADEPASAAAADKAGEPASAAAADKAGEPASAAASGRSDLTNWGGLGGWASLGVAIAAGLVLAGAF